MRAINWISLYTSRSKQSSGISFNKCPSDIELEVKGIRKAIASKVNKMLSSNGHAMLPEFHKCFSSEHVICKQ